MPDFKFSKVKPGQAVQALDFNRLSDDVEAMIAHIAEHFLVNPNTLDNTKGVVLWGCGLTDTSGGGALKVTVGAGAMLLPGNAGANTDLGRTAEEGNPDTRINGNGFRLAILSQTELTLDAHGGTDRTDTIQVELDHEGFGPEDDAGLTESRNVRSVDGDGNQQVDAVAVATQRRTLGKAVVYKSNSASETGKGELATVAVTAGGITITDARRHLWGNASLRGLAALVQQFDSVVGLRGAEDNGRFIGGLRVSTPIEDSGPNIAWANSGTPTATFARRLIGLGSVFGKVSVGLSGVAEAAALSLTNAVDEAFSFYKSNGGLAGLVANTMTVADRVTWGTQGTQAFIVFTVDAFRTYLGNALTGIDTKYVRFGTPNTSPFINKNNVVRGWVRIRVVAGDGDDAAVTHIARGPCVTDESDSGDITVELTFNENDNGANWHDLRLTGFSNVDLRNCAIIATMSTNAASGLNDDDDDRDHIVVMTATVFDVGETGFHIAPKIATRRAFTRAAGGNIADPQEGFVTSLIGPRGHEFDSATDHSGAVPPEYTVNVIIMGAQE